MQDITFTHMLRAALSLTYSYREPNAMKSNERIYIKTISSLLVFIFPIIICNILPVGKEEKILAPFYRVKPASRLLLTDPNPRLRSS